MHHIMLTAAIQLETPPNYVEENAQMEIACPLGFACQGMSVSALNPHRAPFRLVLLAGNAAPPLRCSGQHVPNDIRTTCVPCPAGTYQFGESCTACPPGTWRRLGRSFCKEVNIDTELSR